MRNISFVSDRLEISIPARTRSPLVLDGHGGYKMRNAVIVLLTLCLATTVSAQGGVQVQTAAVTLTSAQLQHLGSTPVLVVATPGAGNLLNVISALAQYKAGASPYTVQSGRLSLFLGDRDNVVAATSEVAGFLDKTTSQVRQMPQLYTEDNQSSFENQPLMVANDGSTEWVNGDGTVTITVTYTIISLQ